MAIPRAPLHLRAATRKWWREIAAGWELQAHEQKILTMAAETLDRIEEAREQVEADGGPFIKNRFGELRPHPALAVERQQRVAFSRLLKSLDLDGEAPPPPKRPQRRH